MKVTLDKARFAAAGLEFTTPVDGVVTIILPGAQDLVRCKVVDGVVELYPQRSSAQKIVAQALGL